MQRSVPLAPDTPLGFLASRIDYERTTMPYGPDALRLDRMRQLLARLGNPEQALAIVHIAGTKGKGSTAAMIASVLRAAGYRAGLYSSPHLDRVEERLAIDGQPCPGDELAGLIERIRPVVEAMDALQTLSGGASSRPTYFEILTALALLHFAERAAQVAVLEVGMGGRLDSTNVCQPLVSVITSISFDHTYQLGNTLAAIAGEKAGIIKPQRPVVSGVVQSEPREVVAQRAAQHGSRLVQIGRDFDFCYRPPRHLESSAAAAHMDFTCRLVDEPFELTDIAMHLIGEHQAANAAVGIATLLELRRQGWNIPQGAIRQGLAEVRWPARVEVFARRPTVVLDAAHNVASAEALARVLEESFVARRRVLVFATTREKDARGMLDVLVPGFDEVILTRYWNNPRGLPPEELELADERWADKLHFRADPPAAWQLASELAGPDDLICITGSFFIAAEMRAAIRDPRAD